MKKTLKFSAAAALAITALTPVAAFAAENETAASGFYTTGKYLTGPEFRALPNAEKASLLTNAETVMVIGGKVYFSAQAIGKGQNQIDALAMTETAFEAQHGALTSTGYGEVVAGELKVESVMAINASELKVTFSAPVTKATATDKANYELKVNNNLISGSNIQDIQLSEDGKTATILLDQSGTKTAFQNGDKFVVQTNDAIVSNAGKKLEKFVSNEITFTQTAAPSLTKVAKSGDNLVLTFDRPVDATAAGDVTLIKVDGIEIGSKELKPVSPKAVGSDILGKAGDYRYTVAITAPAAIEAAKKLGTHEVVIFDVKDTASDYKANASVLNGSYTVTSSVTTPEVTGIEAVNANRFFVSTNVPVTLGADAVVTVNKGTHEFALETTKYDGTIQSAATVTVSDAVVGDYKGKDGIWVTVTDNKGAVEENPLYRTDESTVNLSVTVEKFTADGLIGKKSTQNVTLNKNNTKPVVDTTVLKEKPTGTADELVVTFTNPLVQLDGTTPLVLLAADDYVVRNKEGIIVTGFTAVVSGKDVTFTKDTEDLKDAPYTIEFKEGKFKNAENRTSVANYLANTIKNDKFTVSVGKEVASNFKYTEFQFDATAVTGNTTIKQDIDENSITIKYPTKMDDSARNVANYTLDGKALPAGTTIDFVNDRQTVKVVFPKGTFKTSTQYKFGATSNVKTEAGSMIVGSLQTKAPAELVFGVKDNVKPELASAIYYVGTETVDNQTKTDQIEVTFNEAVNVTTGAANDPANDFAIMINGSMYTVSDVAQATSGDNKDRKLVLTLTDMINVSQGLTISIIPEADQVGATAAVKEIAVQDAAGNKAKEGSTVTLAGGSYKYNAALASSQVAQANAQSVATDKTATNVTTAPGETLSAVKSDVTLVAPLTEGSAISWATTNSAVTTGGLVERPIHSAGDATGNLVATITKGAATDTKTFAVTVLKKNFEVAGETVADNTFTVTPDGYELTDFSAAAGSIEFATGNLPTIDVNGITYTITYDNLTGVATVTATSGTATATADAATETINIIKDGKTETVTLNIPAVTESDAFGTVTALTVN